MGDYVNQVYLVKISNDQWTMYTDKELGFKPYYLGGIQCDSKDRLWGTIDYSFSSSWISPSPHFYIFDGKKSTLLSCGDDMRFGGSPKLTIAQNDYIWCYGISSVCGVWVDEKWHPIERSELGGSSAWAIKEAPNHRIWIGTEDGIFIN
jgi:hypothetical protein